MKKMLLFLGIVILPALQGCSKPAVIAPAAVHVAPVKEEMQEVAAIDLGETVEVESLGLSVKIPQGFQLTTSPSGATSGLLLVMEKENMEPGHFGQIELTVADLEEEEAKTLKPDEFLKNSLLSEAGIEDDKKARLTTGQTKISGQMPAYHADLINPIKTSKETYEMHVRLLAYVKDNQLHKWSFSSRESDFEGLSSNFDQAVQSIKFKPVE